MQHRRVHRPPLSYHCSPTQRVVIVRDSRARIASAQPRSTVFNSFVRRLPSRPDMHLDLFLPCSATEGVLSYPQVATLSNLAFDDGRSLRRLVEFIPATAQLRSRSDVGPSRYAPSYSGSPSLIDLVRTIAPKSCSRFNSRFSQPTCCTSCSGDCSRHRRM